MTRLAASPNKKRLLAGLLVACTVLILACMTIYAFRSQLLTSFARFLIVEEDLRRADVIFLLNGDVNTRPFYASQLLKQGLASRIVVASAEETPVVKLSLFPNPTNVAVGVMRNLGVERESVTVLRVDDGVTSTRDEAVVLRGYVGEQGIEHVLLVTSAFHTRRARWICEKELSGLNVAVHMAAAPHWGFDATNWWQTERGLIVVTNEYIKLLYYLMAYGRAAPPVPMRE